MTFFIQQANPSEHAGKSIIHLNELVEVMASRQNESPPLRVLYVIDSLRMGGAERVTTALLPLLAKSGVSPLLCTLNRKDENRLSEARDDLSIPVFDLSAKRLVDIMAFRRLLRLLDREHVHLIHAHLQDATIFAAAAGRLCRIPTIATRHLVSDDMSTLRHQLRNRLERFIARTAVARVIAVSESARSQFMADASLSPRHCTTIYNGIDSSQFFSLTNKTGQKGMIGLPENVQDAPVIVMIGVIRPGKGHAVAIEAMKRVPGAHLVLVGDGDQKLRVELEAQAIKLSSRIHFLGERQDIPQILAAADMLILPSDTEALPTVLIEAGAAALPAVASNVGGCAEIIVHEETGLLIPSRDPEALAMAINRLLTDRNLAISMGLRARNLVREHFSLQHQAARLSALYKEVYAEFFQI